MSMPAIERVIPIVSHLPASMQRCWSSGIALAVRVMIGSFLQSGFLRISRVAVRPSMTGIITSMRTRSIA